jgi:cytochrome c oxidase subunit 3
MTVTLVFLAVLMAVFVAWLVGQTLNVKPWIAQSATAGHARHVPRGATAPRLGLAVFLAVVTVIFSLTISAYLMRVTATGGCRARTPEHR